MTTATSIASRSRSPRPLGGGVATARNVSLAVGRRIVNDDVIGRPQPDDPFLAGETVYAHTRIASLPRRLSRARLEARRRRGAARGDADRRGRCWRTWSYHRLEAGEYTVEVFAPDGQRLASRSFTAF